MAERELAGKLLLLFRGNGEPTNETFSLVACLTSNDINQTSSTTSTETKCGTIKLPGTKAATVPFSFIPRLSPEAGKVAMETLQDDYKNDVVSNWKATTQKALSGNVAGEPIFTFRGFISELSWKAGTGDAFNGSSTIEVDDDGVTLTMTTGTSTPPTPTTFDTIFSFASTAQPADQFGVGATSSSTDAEQKFEFNKMANPSGGGGTMVIKVGETTEVNISFDLDYAGHAFRYTDKAGTVHTGVFTDGIVTY